MVLLTRQLTDAPVNEIFDDQSPEMWYSFAGNWTRSLVSGYNNGTYTATPTPGAFFSFTFSGTKAVGR